MSTFWHFQGSVEHPRPVLEGRTGLGWGPLIRRPPYLQVYTIYSGLIRELSIHGNEYTWILNLQLGASETSWVWPEVPSNCVQEVFGGTGRSRMTCISESLLVCQLRPPSGFHYWRNYVSAGGFFFWNGSPMDLESPLYTVCLWGRKNTQFFTFFSTTASAALLGMGVLSLKRLTPSAVMPYLLVTLPSSLSQAGSSFFEAHKNMHACQRAIGIKAKSTAPIISLNLSVVTRDPPKKKVDVSWLGVRICKKTA